MERARQLLRDTEMGVAQVGFEVGYTDPGHFGRTFRRLVGCTPLSYRRAAAP